MTDSRMNCSMSPEEICILIVDDDPDQLAVFSTLVSSAGFQIKTASTSGEALKCIEDTNVHLLITDIMMPEIDGLSLISRVRERDSAHIPIIALTASRHDVIDNVGKQDGPDALCMKQNALTDLVGQIEGLLKVCAREFVQT